MDDELYIDGMDGEGTNISAGNTPLNPEETIPVNTKNTTSPLNNSKPTVGAAPILLSPINTSTDDSIESTNVATEGQSSITSKAEKIQPSVNIPDTSGTQININLETTPAVSNSVKNGEVLNSNESTVNANTTNIQNTETALNKTFNSVSNTANTAQSNDSVNKSSKKNSIFNNLKASVINKANTLIPILKNEAREYLGVGKSKLSPVINAAERFENYLDNRKESKIENSKSTSTVNNATSTQGGNSNTESATTTTNKSNSVNNSISVDSTKPVVAQQPAIMPAPVTNTTEVATTTNNNKSTENQVTYGEATQLAPQTSQSTTQSTSTSDTTDNTQNSAAMFDVSELVNEMRSIKMILLGGIDINNKL